MLYAVISVYNRSVHYLIVDFSLNTELSCLYIYSLQVYLYIE